MYKKKEVNDDYEIIKTNRGGYRLVKKSSKEKKTIKRQRE
tara:strand:- start:1425 stop:1544 length:120 start_codon:yes stop_codon:yes gene_type:complete